MKVTTTNVDIVQPANNDAPKSGVWLSNLDLFFPPQYSSIIYFYERRDGTDGKFFRAHVMKDALAKALDLFSPYAGRLGRDSTGRLQISSNGEGVLFVEATCDICIHDIGDFAPTEDLTELVPRLDENLPPEAEAATPEDLFSMPLFMSQVTFFKCGGVCLGIATQHYVADGSACVNFVNTWAGIAKGNKAAMKKEPTIVLDRTILKARQPPKPSYSHPEYNQARPTLKSTVLRNESELSLGMFKFTKEQIQSLQGDAKESTYAVLAAHVWRCVCIARELEPDQTTSMEILVDGRSRLSPPLHSGYFGNAIFLALPMASCRELVSNPVSHGARVIGQAVAKLTDEYLRSSLDYLDLHPFMKTGATLYRSPNVKLNKWSGIPFYDADFGWGKPVHVGPARIGYDGCGYLLPRAPNGDGSTLLAFSLQLHHMNKFKRIIYHIPPFQGYDSKL